jgi:hypothetical protein
LGRRLAVRSPGDFPNGAKKWRTDRRRLIVDRLGLAHFATRSRPIGDNMIRNVPDRRLCRIAAGRINRCRGIWRRRENVIGGEENNNVRICRLRRRMPRARRGKRARPRRADKGRGGNGGVPVVARLMKGLNRRRRKRNGATRPCRDRPGTSEITSGGVSRWRTGIQRRARLTRKAALRKICRGSCAVAAGIKTALRRRLKILLTRRRETLRRSGMAG